MPHPKHMLWIVGLAAGTYVVLRKYEAQKAGTSTGSRFGL